MTFDFTPEFKLSTSGKVIKYGAKFEDFWESCLKRMKEDETYKFVIEENDKLLEEARNVKKEIAKRIEEPWKI